MRKITLKNADKLQTVEITYDGFNYNGKQIQHGALLIVKATTEFTIGGADEVIEYIQTAVRENSFTAYDEYRMKMTTLREMVHAVDSLEKQCEPKQKSEYPQIFKPVEGKIYVNMNGSSYLCKKVEHDQYGVYTRRVEFVSRSGWYLTADCPRQYKDGHIEWDSSYQGHYIELAEAQEMFAQAEKGECI